ncbi:endonuclease/exonuclease/phosphatase family metal-dependent hydrolase [Microvirga lupini]|uniref:Endonuclease/exonuclease/phosphatase family metal-dependent hydrolase n=1 Tax=Microvirga lupini TaxID=420324 RepID=A0A7W4VKR1_9HYPH|nr:endonuclease/exonuclease/phosphatase family protein [Microvirga lupini]MBB3018616.1 endonuclease/exonuclease/phosphatase family metal-dependent hydrolase [Microvirga lupini]
MRPLIDRIVPALQAPDGTVLEEARRASAQKHRVAHRSFLERIPALHTVEQRPPADPLPWRGSLTVAAFNAQRLKDRRAVRHLMRQAGAQVTLLSEVDLGMARSGNMHTIQDLITGQGEGYLYGVEFVELDLGSADEVEQCAGQSNAQGLHGNAIVTGLALERPCLIPLEENGLWFPGIDGHQRRIGGRMALAARVARAPRPLWIVSTHLESKTDPADRQAQIRALLRALDAIAPGEACVIGGDFNTKALPRGEDERQLLLEAPEHDEPLFADLRDAGFTWRHANLALPTQTPGPTNKHEPPFGKFDWLVVRGLDASNPRIIPAVDEKGRAVSDHEMIAVDIAL